MVGVAIIGNDKVQGMTRRMGYRKKIENSLKIRRSRNGGT